MNLTKHLQHNRFHRENRIWKELFVDVADERDAANPRNSYSAKKHCLRLAGALHIFRTIPRKHNVRTNLRG